MLKHILIVCLFGAVLGYSDSDGSEFGQFEVTTSRPGIPYVKYFDCRTTTKQHNKHPWDCTRYIQCDNSNNAFDMPCAACDDPALCPGGGFLEFDGVEIGGNEPSCIWPVHSTCVPGTNETVTDPPTTRPPTTQPPTTRPPTTQPPTTQRSTTQQPTTQTPTTLTPPVGQRCNAKNCTVDGWCRGYKYCERIPSEDEKGPIYDNGVIVEDSCAPLFYNPEQSAGHQVATCSKWTELSQETKDRYARDKDCIPAPCKLEGACQRNYIEIWNDGRPDNNGVCKAGTVLDDVVRRCLPCSEAKRLGAGNVAESCLGQGDC